LSFFDPEQKVEAAEAMFLIGAMVGAIQIFISVFKLGDLTRYISESVIIGFMTAAATLLAVSQLGNALGIHDKDTGAQNVLYRLSLTLTRGDHYNYKALGVTVVTLVLAVSLRKLVRRYRLPQFDMLVTLLIVAVSVYLFGWTSPDANGKTIEPKRIVYAFRASNLDAIVLAMTAVSGLALGLDEAILIGVGMSILIFVPRAAKLKASELVLDDHGVVREKLTGDSPCKALLLYDLEGELFFGAALELERYLTELTERAQAESVNYIVLRVKRLRNPDLVCLERLEHFLKKAESLGITVLLAGVRSNLLEALHRLRFEDWFPKTRCFPRAPTKTRRHSPPSAVCTSGKAMLTHVSIADRREWPSAARGGSTTGFDWDRREPPRSDAAAN
jgi:MFS superfamily sulfate permease-like transporter